MGFYHASPPGASLGFLPLPRAAEGNVTPQNKGVSVMGPLRAITDPPFISWDRCALMSLAKRSSTRPPPACAQQGSHTADRRTGAGSKARHL